MASLLDQALRILRVTTEIIALSDPEDVSRHVVRSLVEELHFQAVSVVLLDATSGQLRYAAETGVPEAVKALGFREQGLTMHAFRTGEAMFVENMAQDAGTNPDARPYFQSYAVLPIQHRNRPFGILIVNYERVHAFAPLERQILRTFASQIAVALDNSQLLAATQQRADTLSALAHLGQALAERMDLTHALSVLEDSLRTHLPQMETAAFWLLEGRNHLVPGFHYGLGLKDGELLPRDLIEGVDGGLLASKGPQILPFLQVLGQDLPPRKRPWGDGLALVLRTASGVEGLLLLHAAAGPGILRPLDLDFLCALTDQAALAIHHARIFASTRDSASLDSLTGLLNHGALLTAAQERITQTAQEGSPLSLLMLDADHFKISNDTHGHPFGDKVLVALAKILKAHVRPSDLVGRWGGEEFVVVLPGADTEMAFRVAERIRRAMASMVLSAPGGQKVPAPTVSIGIATREAGGKGFAELLQCADTALYQAKYAGRNLTIRFDPTLSIPGESLPTAL